MVIVTYREPLVFRQAVGSFLMEKEAENCLLLGILHALVGQPSRFSGYHLFAVRDGGEGNSDIVGAGLMTPPLAIVLTELPNAAVPLVVQHATSFAEGVPGILAPRATATAFKDAWLASRGGRVALQLTQRLFELTSVVHPPPIEGSFRRATQADRSVLEPWHQAFVVECKLLDDGVEACRVGLETGSRYVWEVGGELVTMVGFSGETPSGIRVNWVYTPPSRRGRGYASALVAAISQKLLDEGRKRCFLYADAENPTATGIYQRLGYRPVSDSLYVTFGA